jgi:hypothetical protein
VTTAGLQAFQILDMILARGHVHLEHRRQNNKNNELNDHTLAFKQLTDRERSYWWFQSLLLQLACEKSGN